MEASQARLYHQKKAKVSYDQVAIAASLPKHQGIPEEIIGRRTTKGKPEYEIKWKHAQGRYFERRAVCMVTFDYVNTDNLNRPL